MEEGWIKLHRKMREWQHYQRPSVRLVFEELLFCANTNAVWFHGIKINRGETIVSIDTICTFTGFSRATVVAALKILEDTKEIKRSKCWRGTRTKILNFDKYQNISSSTSSIESSSNSELQTELLTELQTELLIKPKQEIKNNKKEKNNIISTNVDTSGADAPDKKLSSQDKVDYVGIINFFNRTMEEEGASIPRCKSCEGKRKDFVRARVKQHGIDAVYEMITKASVSDFLNGRTSKPFLANFEWLFRPTNFQKVLEGIYDNRKINTQQSNAANQFTDPRQTEREKLAERYAATIARLAAEDDARAGKVR